MKLTTVTHPTPRGSGKFHRRNPGNPFNQRTTLAIFCISLAWIIAPRATQAGEPAAGPPLTQALTAPSSSDIWVNGVGEGFRPTAQSVSLGAGVAAGFAAFGGRQCHDLALASISYGHMLGPVRGGDHWYRGNWEMRGELFAGGQFAPDENAVVGLTPHLRYNFATGTRWVPFADVGAGVTATSISGPDLSGTFEFNLQPAIGTHWFIRDNLALTAEVRYLHMSCAGLHSPNLGLNAILGMVGLTWFF